MKRTEPDDRFWSDGSDKTITAPKKRGPKLDWLDRLWIWVIALSFMFWTSWRL